MSVDTQYPIFATATETLHIRDLFLRVRWPVDPSPAAVKSQYICRYTHISGKTIRALSLKASTPFVKKLTFWLIGSMRYPPSKVWLELVDLVM